MTEIEEVTTQHLTISNVLSNSIIMRKTNKYFTIPQRFCGAMGSKGAKLLKTKTLEMGGIHRSEFVEYFLKLAEEAQDQETFKGCGWEVQVGKETWSSLGIFKICHVLITFHVEEDLFDKFLSRFQLRFLRGGG